MRAGPYTLAATGAAAATVGAELCWLRTGIFRRPSYWTTIAIVFAFQVPVDGLLTKLPDPVVIYSPDHMSGLRFPWSIPIEDWAFGFSLVTLGIALWERGQRHAPGAEAEATP